MDTPDIPETTITVVDQPVAELERLVDQARQYAEQAKAPNTLRAYRADLAHFSAWCRSVGEPELPATPATVAVYVARLAEDRKTSTIQRRLVAISQVHKAMGLESPTAHPAVRAVLKGVLRSKGSAPSQKAALGTAELRALLARTPATLIGVRDRAVLLLGFAAALRRAEIVALDVADVSLIPEQGLIVHVRRSKTDGEGRGTEIAVPHGKRPETCPVLAVRSWLQKTTLTEGPLFRPIRKGSKPTDQRLSDRAVARVVQRYAHEAGLNPGLYGGHSLRAGFVTAAAALDVAEHLIQEVTGHKSIQVLRGYVRKGAMFNRCPLREMDL